MFKKAVEFKSQTAVGGKPLKKLKSDAAACFPLMDEDAGLVFPPKAEINCRKVAQGGSKTQVYFCGSTPILVDGGRGDYAPTVMACWLCPDMLPCFYVPHQVSKFVCGGADLMLPGVLGMSHENMLVNSLACVKVMGNPAPIAVGVVLFDPGSHSVSEGRVMSALTWYGDCLWEAAGKPVPNEGFKDGYVESIGAPCPVGGRGKTPAAAGGGEAGGDGGDGGDREEGGEEGDGKGDGEGGREGMSGLSTEEMDVLLERSFLQAVRTTVKDKELPIEVSVLYLQHMRPAREAGTSVDVKRSSYKKLLPFLAAMQAQGVAKVQTAKGITKLVAVVRSSEKVRNFDPIPLEQTEGGRQQIERAREDMEALRPSAPPVEVTEMVKPHASMYGGIFAPEDKGAMSTAKECRDRLGAYIEREQLVDPDDPNLVLLDPHLYDALFSGQQGPSITHMKRQEVAKVFRQRLETWFEVRGGMLKQPRLERARMVEVAGGVKEARCSVCVNIKTENRRGHNVTILRGLEVLGVDADAFAEEMKTKFAASTSVQEVGSKDEMGKHYEVMLQGLWDKTLSEYLMLQYNLPKVCLDVRAKKQLGEKAAKSASNIIKS